MIFQFNQYRVDTDRFQLFVQGAVQATEPQVFDLLVYLIKNRDRVVSRDELLENLWEGKVVTDSALSARLKDARKAVGDSGDQQSVIKTFHGRGYQFIAELNDSAALKPESTLPDKPSIIVLPFKNISNDPEQDFFADGITEDMITALARFRELIVVDKNTAFRFKNQDLETIAIGKQLGVRFAIEGSVRKAGDQVRVAANLIDATTGIQVWGEHYDRKLDDIFKVQDEVVKATVAAATGHLRHEEVVRVEHQSFENLKVYDLIRHATSLIYEFDKAGVKKGIALLERALDIEPNNAQAHAWLGCAYLVNYNCRYIPDPDSTLTLALKHGKQAVKLDEVAAEGHYALSETYLYGYKNIDEARESAERSMNFNPGASESINWMGFLLCTQGLYAQGIPMVEEASRLDPMAPRYQRATTGMSYYLAGNFDKAIACLRSVDIDSSSALIYLTAAYQAKEQHEAAMQTATRVLELSLRDMESKPKNWAEHFVWTSGLVREQDLKLFKSRITAAGIPDGSYSG